MADAKITELTELITPADGDLLAIVDIDAGPATTKKIQLTNLLNDQIFGSKYQYIESEGESSNATASFVNKATMTTPSIPAGDYRIGWSYGWRNNNTGGNFLGRVQVDDVTDVMTHTSRPINSSADQIYRCAGFRELTLTAAAHTIDLDFAASSGTSTIEQARLEIWRVS